MGKSFKDLQDRGSGVKVSRIVEQANGRLMRREYKDSKVLSYEDVPLTKEEELELAELKDVPY